MQLAQRRYRITAIAAALSRMRFVNDIILLLLLHVRGRNELRIKKKKPIRLQAVSERRSVVVTPYYYYYYAHEELTTIQKRRLTNTLGTHKSPARGREILNRCCWPRVPHGL